MNGLEASGFRDPALVDFGPDGAGMGRRLERLGGVLVDRPLPHAAGPRCRPEVWGEAQAVFTPSRAGPGRGQAGGRWEFRGQVPAEWRVELPVGPGSLRLEIRPAPSGQVGLFLEQAPHWRWLAAVAPPGGVILSLFGHSGAATLALAAAGAEVVHVDASRQAIALARRNAAASGLEDRPIEWVRDDAVGFLRRQERRGRAFSGAVIDPPSWGHGPRGEAFAIDRDLTPLVAAVARLVARPAGLPGGPLLLTAHTPGWHHARLRNTLLEACVAAGLAGTGLEAGPLGCSDDAGRLLHLGGFARCLPHP